MSVRLAAASVSKRYGATVALDDVSVEIRPHEILGLIGENGAGKSTLLNVLSGVVAPDRGHIEIDRRVVKLRDYHHATKEGIFRVFQELSFVPNLSVAENFVLGHEKRFASAGVINQRRVRNYTREALESFSHAWIDPSTITSRLDFATRQVLETVRAIALAELLEIESPVVMFDEATAGLPRTEVGFFVSLVRQLKARGAAVVFVSHRLGELLDVSDRIVVLKDGRVVATPDEAVEERQLHQMMTGRARSESLYREERQREPGNQVALSCANVRGRGFGPVSLEVNRGEIVGLAGVIGSGKSSLLRALFDGTELEEGETAVGGRVVASSPSDMVRAGVGYVAPDRQLEGVLADQSLTWNVTLAQQAVTGIKWVLSPSHERATCRRMMDTLRIKAPGPWATPRMLSGGNQQKVVLARWIACDVDVLLLDNPTKGIDVGAKEELYELMRDFTERGGAVLLVSDELVELIGLSNRVIVMRDGVISHEADSSGSRKPDESDLVEFMV